MMNQYRVAEAQRLFASPEHQHYKIESIGQMSGFNSKASFFSVFKKLTGTTPQAFKEELTSKKTGSV
ncbi:helix-turn-helix domain-containing protein [Chitinophaga sedimenti]|uniref:helix-turn-helix domain-containing protein n=1 Tax=Chitinophaga sedimenti TaxID=2033606 RepID=UPI00200609CF|nr:helix-turn-helix domain-containing protein [Chitinophaga sedimenti]MCK7556513.1 helix-turn-helix domain-containing protein [Chitinophaga sedimenti]